jgi:hypothetical protein
MSWFMLIFGPGLSLIIPVVALWVCLEMWFGTIRDREENDR